MFLRNLPKMPYGGDYNPDQWPRETWDEDMRLFALAGIDIATINVFSWARNQPDEETFNFAWLDELFDLLHENGVKVCLGTGTAAHPAWMARRYPDVLSVDYHSRQRKFGGRHNACPNSPSFRKFSQRIASELAQRYGDHPALLLWHVNNEYGWHCYCDNCTAAFRVWLQAKYGTLDALNAAWNTSFWSHIFYDWNEIVLPNRLSDHRPGIAGDVSYFPAITLDYYRFASDALLDCYLLEANAIKAVQPNAVVTTNFKSNGMCKQLDYHKWAKHLDVLALDTYPTNDMPPSQIALRYDLVRGMQDGRSYMLMEQVPNVLNWKDYNPLKRPGVMRLWSYQAVARGADSVMFFQLRRSRGAFEKFHGAIIDHVGHEHTRVFRECAELGAELQQLGDRLLDARTDNAVALLFDWDNWWGVEFCSGPSIALDYVAQVEAHYNAFFDQHIPVDVVAVDADLDQYKVIVAPVLYMVKPGVAARLTRFVERGGTLLTTFFSGIVNETDLVTTDGYPGELRDLLGIWVEETDALFPDQRNGIAMRESLGALSGTYDCGLLCDVVHVESAESLATYTSNFYAGSPALTRNKFGDGEAYYLATSAESAFLRHLVRHLCDQHAITPLLDAPTGVEVTQRSKDGHDYLFLLNHNATPATCPLGDAVYHDLLTEHTLSGDFAILGYGVAILERKT